MLTITRYSYYVTDSSGCIHSSTAVCSGITLLMMHKYLSLTAVFKLCFHLIGSYGSSKARECVIGIPIGHAGPGAKIYMFSSPWLPDLWSKGQTAASPV